MKFARECGIKTHTPSMVASFVQVHGVCRIARLESPALGLMMKCCACGEVGDGL
jgi:hypothetical protein